MEKKKLTRSEAKKAYWANISKEDRAKWGRKAAIAKAKKMTAEERSAHGRMMVAARNKK